MSGRLKILVVEPDRMYGRLANSILKNDFDTIVTQSPFDAMEQLGNNTIDILITNYELPGGNGLRLIKRAKQRQNNIEVIMTGQDTAASIIDEAMQLGAIDYFQKPFDYESVKMAIERTKKFVKLNKKLKKAETERENLSKELEEQSGGFDIISQSPEMDKVKKMMKMVAQSRDTSVIITGESGAGKELVARGIHNMSERHDHHFGAVNMSAISETLFESEFFGHIKGSFTGAIADRAGWFEVANNGTLFLDEIGDMPMSLQIKMLRVLEDRKFIKVGSQKEQSFDVRLLAATNKDIEEMKNGKAFRVDLFHRIGTFEIFIPPLRERKDDISLLLHFFMKKFANKMRRKISKIDKETLKKLKNYPFPGNVRELRNIVERAVILCEGDTLGTEHFPNIVDQTSAPVIPDELYNLEEIEKMVIKKALERCQYNKTQAAKLLNINWNALHRRLDKYGIQVS